ncbi:MAG: hypothetical protein V3U35_00595 [Candidatus Neomarinimicrobiota bacterium]
MRPRHLTLFAVGAALGKLSAGQPDTSQAADSLARPEFSWTQRMVPYIQDVPKPYRLYLPWDEWAHSDLVATAANPFVPADLLIGAAYLDGSLGQPIFSALNPSAVVELGVSHGRRPQGGDGTLPPEAVRYVVAPMGDAKRSNQTYFFWDQGDYLYRDVQVGGAVQLGENRSIATAAQSRSHPGRERLAGPSPGQSESGVLQNYLVDYQRKLSEGLAFTYTLLRQDEQVGLPWTVKNTTASADRRRTRTWAQGFQVDGSVRRWSVGLNAAGMISDLQTTTDGEAGKHLDRRSLSIRAGARASYHLSPGWDMVGTLQMKTRHITDDDSALGLQSLSLGHGRVGARWTGAAGSIHGGLALIDGGLEPEGLITLGSNRGMISLGTAATSFFDYPHRGRRTTPDSPQWLPGPVALRRFTLAGQVQGSAGHLSLRVAALQTGDDRTALTGGLDAAWTLWEEVLRWHGTVTMASSPDSLLFPTRLYAVSGLTFTLPLRRSRARPYVSGTAMLLSNELAWWPDPLYADLTPFRYEDLTLFMEPPENTTTAVLWVSGEVGLKVANFELRMRLYNPLGQTIQNSPLYLPQPGYGGPAIRRFRHYSMSWQFLPGGG